MEYNIPAYEHQPIPELLRQLSANAATLIRQEVQLARAELTQNSKKAGKSVQLFGTSATFGLGAFGALTATIIARSFAPLSRVGGRTRRHARIRRRCRRSRTRRETSLKALPPPVPEQTAASLRHVAEAVRAVVRHGL
jgi:hypothetical protein